MRKPEILSGLLSLFQFIRGEMKKSRFKIWLRAALLIQFCGIFGFFLFRDISHGYFNWGWVSLNCCSLCANWFFDESTSFLCKQIQLRRESPFRWIESTLVLIWVLVIAKVITGQVQSLTVIADIIMCLILGIMSGRLGGIGLRVRDLKVRHGFLTKQV